MPLGVDGGGCIIIVEERIGDEYVDCIFGGLLLLKLGILESVVVAIDDRIEDRAGDEYDCCCCCCC